MGTTDGRYRILRRQGQGNSRVQRSFLPADQFPPTRPRRPVLVCKSAPTSP